jgi:glycine hydroxymethyltransferase
MSHQIVKNAKALAMRLIEHGFDLAAGGTDNHLILMSVGKGRGQFMQDALDIAGITMNKNTIPNEPCSPFHPSGVRMGTPIMTMRGMKEEQMVQVADWMKRVFDNVASFEYSEDKEERKKILQAFTTHIQEDTELQTIRKEVAELCSDFPIYQ